MNAPTVAPEVLDTVLSFAEYTGMSLALVYQYTRGKGFPKIQACKNGKILIDRAAAIEWMRRLPDMGYEPPSARMRNLRKRQRRA